MHRILTSKTFAFSAAALLLACPFVVRAQNNGTGSIPIGQGFRFSTGSVVSTGGPPDITFSTAGLVFDGSATGGLLGGTGSAFFSGVDLQQLETASNQFSNKTIPFSSLTTNTVLGVHTNTGGYAKAILNNISSSSLAFQFTNFDFSITNVANNSSFNGFPIGIQPGSIASVTGIFMPPATPIVLQDTVAGLPLKLNARRFTLHVGSHTFDLPIYYAGILTDGTSAAGVEIPSSTSLGSGLLTVTSDDGQTASANVNVVPSGYGFTTHNGFGVFTDAVTGFLPIPSIPTKWGETLLSWGTGFGLDFGHSDTNIGGNTVVPTPFRVFLGGQEIQPLNLYGPFTELYPGVQGFGITLPNGSPTGCAIPFLVLTGSGSTLAASSTGYVSVTQDGQPCDTNLGMSAGQIAADDLAEVIILQLTRSTTAGSTNTTANSMSMKFESLSGLNVFDALNFGTPDKFSFDARSGCGFSSLSSTTPPLYPGSTALDGGSFLTIQSAAGASTVPQISRGYYSGTLPSAAIPVSGGTLSLANGSGGVDVNPFILPVTIAPNPFDVSLAGISSIDRSQDLNLVVTPGRGGSIDSVTLTGGSLSLTCHFPGDSPSITIPHDFLQLVQGVTGSLTVRNIQRSASTSSPVGFSVTPRELTIEDIQVQIIKPITYK